MNTPRLLVTLALIWPGAVSFAGEARVLNALSVELHTMADPQFGPMTIRATASADRHVQSLSLTYQSRTIDVRADALTDLRVSILRAYASVSPFPIPLNRGFCWT